MKKNLSKSFSDIFSSIRLTVFLLIILAAVSVIGTLIQQNLAPSDYIKEYGYKTYQLFHALGFFDLYHSWWFRGLLGLLSINLVVCSFKRLPGVWKGIVTPKTKLGDNLKKTLRNVKEFNFKGGHSDVEDAIASKLKKRFRKLIISKDNEDTYIFCQKGRFSRLGVYVTHTSLLVIFVGALLGSFFGFKANVNIVEGESVNEVYESGTMTPIPLLFEVKCNEFNVEFYPNSDRPKEFTSNLEIIENGTVIKEKTIEVNDPLRYKGITFYQSSYGSAGMPTLYIDLKNNATDERKSLTVSFGEKIPIENSEAFYKVVNFAQDYQGFGPTAFVEFYNSGELVRRFPVFQKYPDFEPHRGGDYSIIIKDYTSKEYTGLQVTKDPGVWFVWTGCLLLVLGLIEAFFVSHKRIWVRIRPVYDKLRVTVAGTTDKNRQAFQREFDCITNEIQVIVNKKL